MVASTATVETAKASRYLQQLCKHFGHKIEVEFTPESGCLPFAFGLCRLEADASALRFYAEAADVAELARLEQVIGSHFERFAFRDDLKVSWQRRAA